MCLFVNSQSHKLFLMNPSKLFFKLFNLSCHFWTKFPINIEQINFTAQWIQIRLLSSNKYNYVSNTTHVNTYKLKEFSAQLFSITSLFLLISFSLDIKVNQHTRYYNVFSLFTIPYDNNLHVRQFLSYILLYIIQLSSITL